MESCACRRVHFEKYELLAFTRKNKNLDEKMKILMKSEKRAALCPGVYTKITVLGYKKWSNSKCDGWQISRSQKYGWFHLSESSSCGRNIAIKIRKNGRFCAPHDSCQFEGFCLSTTHKILWKFCFHRENECRFNWFT